MIRSTLLQLTAVSLCSTSMVYAAEPVGIPMGGFELYPVVMVNVSHDDNIFAQEKVKKSSVLTTINPGLKVVLAHGTNEYSAEYYLAKGFYQSSSSDNFLDHIATVSADLNLSSRLSSQLQLNYNKKHDPRGSTFTGSPLSFKTPDLYHEVAANGKVSYGINARIAFQGDYSLKRYDNHQTVTQSRDMDMLGGDVTFYYPIASKSSAFIEARYKRFDYKQTVSTLDSNEQRLYVGLEWEATAKTTGSARFGYLKKKFVAATQKTGSNFSWEVGVLWEPLSYSSWDISSSSGSVESDGTGSYTQTTNGSLTWNHEWSSSLSHTALISYTQSKYKGVVKARTDNLTTAGLTLNYELNRWLIMNGGYTYTSRRSNAVNSSFQQNLWSLGFKAAI
ncbi:MAG: outer membrane beta-barrel protein [Mariprofundus sp.]|nr:outer membrane beta-barrel protein [Mariprofundus sp.]